MKKELFIFLALIALAGVVLFADQVWAWIASMGPLDAVKQIVTFFLHVAVATIAGTVALGLPKIVKPWVKMLRRPGRRWQGGPRANWRRESTVPAQPRVRMPKIELKWNPTRRSAATSPNGRAPFGDGSSEEQINIRM